MADFCQTHRDQLESKHHSFIDKMPSKTRRWSISLKERGYLVSLYIQLGGE
jgi:hypothetical protein